MISPTSPYTVKATASIAIDAPAAFPVVVTGATTAGTTSVIVKATDSGNPPKTVTGPESIVVSPAPLSLTMATLPDATVGVPYSATIGVSAVR